MPRLMFAVSTANLPAILVFDTEPVLDLICAHSQSMWSLGLKSEDQIFKCYITHCAKLPVLIFKTKANVC